MSDIRSRECSLIIYLCDVTFHLRSKIRSERESDVGYYVVLGRRRGQMVAGLSRVVFVPGDALLRGQDRIVPGVGRTVQRRGHRWKRRWLELGADDRMDSPRGWQLWVIFCFRHFFMVLWFHWVIVLGFFLSILRREGFGGD